MQDTRDKHPSALSSPLALIEEIQGSYAPNVVWDAPRRGVTWIGRQEVVENLLREAAAMQGLQVTRLRSSCSDVQVIDEFVCRFRYSGEGIENVTLPAGAAVELERLRILTLANKQITLETSIETWTVLEPQARAAVSAQE
jgi:hypothetical protein